MRKLTFALAVLLALTTVGCSAFRALNPFDSVSAADAEFTGVKSGPVVGVTPTLAGALPDPRASALADLLGAFGQSDPVGVLMPVSLVGETAPRWVLCADRFREKCQQIPVNSVIHFAGRPAGIFWRPSRLTADGFND